ncbi:MAG: pyridoxal phosphate-dependent aminotransferase [Rhizobiaceae bacterium]
MNLSDGLRPVALELDESDIVAVVNSARTRTDVIPLWVGEGDLPTPEFIMKAAKGSLARGETFYTWQRGIPALRQELADYHERVYGIANDPSRFYVTGSGMISIQLALQALVGAGDEVIVPTPVWPNIHSATQVAGACPVHVPMNFSENGWSLDLNRLFGAVTDETRAIFLNSPANPTGWVASGDTISEILNFSRKTGVWIIADEVYSRFVYEGDRAPSFYDYIDDEDRVILVNTFSKNWAMTGWRTGWISAPEELGQVFENLIQYSTSGVPEFSQHAAIAAVRQGEEFLAMQKLRAVQNRDVLCNDLLATGRVQLARPQGAFYLFFKVEGHDNSKELALRLINEAGVGLAPGTGFYAKQSEYLRLCFMRDPKQIQQATNRLVNWLAKN